jgi:hypothetical protein
MTRGIFGLATLVVIGVIIADIATHPDALKIGGQQLNNLTISSFTGLLGQTPSPSGYR